MNTLLYVSILLVLAHLTPPTGVVQVREPGFETQVECHAWIDEHIIVDGEIIHINEDIIDENLNNFTWWMDKHKSYATREAINFLLKTLGGSNPIPRHIFFTNKLVNLFEREITFLL